MNYVSCIGCTIDKISCGRRKDIKTGVAGLNITSVRFKCDARKPKFASGERATVSWNFYDGEYADEVTFKVTILKESKPGRFQIKVDDGPSIFHEDDGYVAPECLTGNGFATASHTILAPLDEPALAICKACDSPVGINCYSEPEYPVDGCLKHQCNMDKAGESGDGTD